MGTRGVVCCVMLIALVQNSLARFLPYVPHHMQNYLNLQNQARQAIGEPPLIWDTKLQNYARNYVNKLAQTCEMVHSNGPYGENLAWGSGENLTPKDAVDMWVKEKSNYDYNSNACTAGMCGHYTQVVWRDTLRVGCAIAKCTQGDGSIISCNYDPPGNYVGERPY